MPAPRKTKLIKFPPSRAGKDVKCPGYARGGMFKLRFDRYITNSAYSALCAKTKIFRLTSAPGQKQELTSPDRELNTLLAKAITINNALNFRELVSELVRKVSNQVQVLKRHKRLIPT